MEEVSFRSCNSNQEKQEERAPLGGEMTGPRSITSALPLGSLGSLPSVAIEVESKLPELPQRHSRPEGICRVSLSHAWIPQEGLERRWGHQLSPALEPAPTDRACLPASLSGIKGRAVRPVLWTQGRGWR